MNQNQLYSMIGDLTNDPNHDRYTTSQIDQFLDNVQNRWNVEAGILSETTTLTTVADQAEYPLSGLTGNPINFRRVTHRGLELEKKSKSYFDLYTGDDWSDDIGTPTFYYIDTIASAGFKLVLFPVPQESDSGANLVCEYIFEHTPMASDSDLPFNGLTLLTPYHYGIAYETGALLLAQDPDVLNQVKMDRYQRVANNVLAEVIQVFKALGKEEPMRLVGGRFWKY